MIAQRLAGLSLLAAAALGVLTSSSALARPDGGARQSPPARKAPASVATPRSEAYYQFMLGRSLEGDGEIDGAIKAYGEASRLDPKSAEVVAELAGLYARENKIHEAIDTAQAALKIDPANASAHRVLGIIDATMARIDQGTGRLDGDAATDASAAAEHLEAARQASEIPEPGLDMMLARIYMRTGMRDKAIAVLGRVVVEEPGQPEPVSLLLQLYQQAGRQADAIALLESVVADEPSFYRPLGELYEQQQRWDDAARAYQRAMALNDGGPDVRTQLAIAWLSGRDPAKAGRAVELLEQVRKENPADPRVLYILSQAERAVGRLDQAETTARELMTIAPGSVRGPYALALVFAQKQQFRQVVDTLAPIVDKQATSQGGLGPEYAPLLLRLGLAAVELGEGDRALTFFEQARAASGSVPIPLIDVYVLEAQLAARHYAEATTLASKLRASQPGDLRVLRLSAEALRQLGQTDEGAALLTGALEQHPDDVMAYLTLAEFDAQVGRYDAALGVLDRASTKFPSSVDVQYSIGSVLAEQKRFAEAEQKFREVLARDPRHAATLNHLGYMLANRGERLDESIGYIKRALEVDPYNGAFLDSLGWAYFRQNQLDLAEENLKKAADQRVRDSAIQDHFGDVLFKRGRYQEAASAWQRALDGDLVQVDRAAIEKKLRSATEKARKH
jgi:tetratricopeptide (TPR) repeat protein